MPLQLNINTDAVVVFTNKLEKLPKTAFPNAVRGALNSMAFDVKKNTMPKQSRRFVNRTKNFFKANSRVMMARGSNIDFMKSEVGFIATGRTKNNKAVDELEQQEHGGKIKDREYIPYATSRIGKSKRKKVAPRNRLGNISIKEIVKTSNIEGKNDKVKFVRAVLMAGKGGFVQSKWKGKETVWRVNSINRTKDGRFKLTPLYSFKSGRSVTIKRATHFMEKASSSTAKKGEKFYIQQAEREFKKHLR